MNSKGKVKYGLFGIDTIFMLVSIIYYSIVMIIFTSCHNPLVEEMFKDVNISNGGNILTNRSIHVNTDFISSYMNPTGIAQEQNVNTAPDKIVNTRSISENSRLYKVTVNFQNVPIKTGVYIITLVSSDSEIIDEERAFIFTENQLPCPEVFWLVIRGTEQLIVNIIFEADYNYNEIVDGDFNEVDYNNEIISDNEIEQESIEENKNHECNHEWWYENHYNENVSCICEKEPNEHIEYGIPNFEYYRTEEIYFHRTIGTNRVSFDVLDLNNLLKSIYDYLNELDITTYAGYKSWFPVTTNGGGGYYYGSYTRNNWDMFIEGKNDEINTLEDLDIAPSGIYYNGQLIFISGRGRSDGILSNFKVTLYKEVEIPSIDKISYSF